MAEPKQHSAGSAIDANELYPLCRPLALLMRLGGMFFFEVQGMNSCSGTSTTWSPVTSSEPPTWSPESTTQEGTTSTMTMTPEPVCDPCTGIGCPNSQRDCMACLFSGGDEIACEETTTSPVTISTEPACNPCTGTGGPDCVKDCFACLISGDETPCEE